ncbi:hypothetical protein GY45DRAFT_1334921 [Cubamyces sp. BRFM 1775]|nr:hypothetical protein GY45DRAFT_1334921 [Cubamyces sp. BRFM 1775]
MGITEVGQNSSTIQRYATGARLFRGEAGLKPVTTSPFARSVTARKEGASTAIAIPNPVYDGSTSQRTRPAYDITPGRYLTSQFDSSDEARLVPRSADTTRVISEDPLVVVGDTRYEGAPCFLYLPPGQADMVFVDYLDTLRSVARWPVWSQSPASPPEAAFSVQDVPGKGKGMIARRAIKGGELIWSERPIYAARRTLTCASDQTDANGVFYRAALQRLSAASKRTFFELGSAYPQSEFDIVPGILNTNCLEISISNGDPPGDPDPDPNDSFAGLFPTLSRANHSCRPSANYYFSVQSFTGQLWATQDISPGEEITITYTPLTAPRMERRAFLAPCAIPASQAETSDRRRIAICELLARLQHTQYPPRIPKAELEQILEWAAAERMTVEYAKVLLYGSQVFTLYGDPGTAEEWATRARSAFRMVEGEGSHHLSR